MFNLCNVYLHFYIIYMSTFLIKKIMFTHGLLLSFWLLSHQFNFSQISLKDILKFPFCLYANLFSDNCLLFKEKLFYRLWQFFLQSNRSKKKIMILDLFFNSFHL